MPGPGKAPRPPLYQNPNTPSPQGMVTPGNIDLRSLPITYNPDGSYSTLYSTSFTDERKGSPTYGKDVLVRGFANGRKTDDVNAIRNEYYRTGRHLGVFQPGTGDQYRNQTDPATAYGVQIHNDWAAGKIPGVQMPDPARMTAQSAKP
jgi:hypothetical protein